MVSYKRLDFFAWRECRFLLTPAAKNNSVAHFCAIEPIQVLRLQNPNFANSRCSGAAPGFFFVCACFAPQNTQKREETHIFIRILFPAKNQFTAPRN